MTPEQRHASFVLIMITLGVPLIQLITILIS